MKKYQIKLKKAFTLVELIIVITILAILATIAFISFQNYTKNARDGNRLATLKNIEKGLILFQLKSGNYPIPDEKINIEASGSILSYQGIVGETLARIINMNTIPTDPVGYAKYIYSTNINQNKYQLMAYMEGTDYITFLPQTYANNLSQRYPKTIGDNLGIILDENNNIPTTTKVETYSGTTNYKIVFLNSDILTSSGNTLFSNIYNRRDDLINNKDIAKLDDSLVGYWDMETLTGTLLKDLSKYGNHGTCYNGGTIVNCDGSEGGPQFINNNGINGGYGLFGKNKYIRINHSSSLNIPDNLTISLFLNSNTTPIGYAIHPIKKGGATGNYLLYYFGTCEICGTCASGTKSGTQCSGGTGDIRFYGGHNNVRSPTYKFLGNYSNNRFITYTYNDGGKLYLDGKQIGGIFGSGILHTDTSALFIGNSINNDDIILMMDEIRIYNRALSNEEIKQLYNATK